MKNGILTKVKSCDNIIALTRRNRFKKEKTYGIL